MAWVEVRVGAPASALVDESGPCFACGGPTNTLDFSFECWLHLGACTRWLRRLWIEALAEVPEALETEGPF